MQDRYLPDRQNSLATHGRTIHWVRNCVGIIGLALEGLLAFFSLALVGLLTLAFLVPRRYLVTVFLPSEPHTKHTEMSR
jgi:hypothetical protein